MAFDYKREYKDLYRPGRKPALITVPPMNYVAVRGKGDPNAEGGSYQQALQMLYGISFTIKMAPRSRHAIDGYFEYTVPPLEGFWKTAGGSLFDPSRKDRLEWISCIRLPEFATEDVLEWAKAEAARKKGSIFDAAEFLTVDEGLCVQCMHLGPYDSEPATIEAIESFADEAGCAFDHSHGRLHHEIYLSDPRRTAAERLKTVIRIPVAPR